MTRLFFSNFYLEISTIWENLYLDMLFCLLVDIMGPDDFRPRVNNNAYTNAAVSLAIHWARYMACLCNR